MCSNRREGKVSEYVRERKRKSARKATGCCCFIASFHIHGGNAACTDWVSVAG